MTLLARLRVLPALLAVAAASVSIGTSLFGDFRGTPAKAPPAAGNPDGRPDGAKLVDDLAVTRFTTLPALTYKPKDGDTLFAWQVKPALDPAPARPRDVLVVVDTSASQAGRPLQQARQIVLGLAAALAAGDRVSVWTANTPAATRPLTKDFQPANSEDVKAAAAALTETEYGSGATDLKGSLAKALGTLAPNRGRQQVVLFLGDGDSAYDPVTEADRVALGGRMDQADVFFFAVPLGVRVNANNLHGLAALTGGAVVRVQEDLSNVTKRGEFVARLTAALDVPVLKPESVTFGADVAETFPTRLPPLRADKPTLVLGKLKAAAPRVTAEVKGVVGTRPVTVALGHDLPAPLPEHFFLNLMFQQWKDAPHKDAPAVLQADRALALASTQINLYREEYITQATWAVSMDRLDDAAKLYRAAATIDPNNAEVGAGLGLVERMKTGRITRADLDKQAAVRAEKFKLDKAGAVRAVIQEGAQPAPQPGAAQPPAPGGAAPQAPADLIQEAAELRRVEEQRYRVLVDATIRRARELLRADPDGAYQELKRQRDDILAYAGIGDAARNRYVSDLTAVMQEIFLKGAEVKRQAAAERDQVAKTRQRLNEFDRQQAEEDRTKARIDAFRQLMQQARYELAYQEAQLMIQERISRGEGVPAAATASYTIGQNATQLREWRELVRIREDRFLLTMMQAEKSHIPYPDEPPVHFPPAAVWRQLTEGDGQRPGRREKYGNTLLGAQPSPSLLRLKSILEDGPPVDLGAKDLKTTPLKEVIGDLEKRYDILIRISNSLEALDDSTANAANLKGGVNLNGLRLGTFLDVYLRGLSVPNVTYVVRPDYIEITSYEARLVDKVTTTFAVADLVLPIPKAVNQAVLQQSLAVQQQTLAIFGQAAGAAQFLGGGGFLGVNGAGGGAAFGGGGAPPGGGAGGNPIFNGGQGGGIVGLGGGGGVGQFGNLGGQFGLQGGTQERLLIGVIVETVARDEWSAKTLSLAGVPGGGIQVPGGGADAEASFLDAKQQNSLGYYPPAYALIVRGTGRYLPYGGTKLEKKEGGMAARPKANPPAVAAGPAGAPPAGGPAAAAPPAGRPAMTNPKVDAEALARALDKNPKVKWNQAVDWTVTDPGMIVAAADFLMGFDEYGHAAEVLKAGMRKGLTTEAWTQDALHVALQMSNGSPEEIERAALSGIDLDPADPKTYLRAAKAEAELKNHDLAVALCRRAADRDPDQPAAYANALAYAEQARGATPDTVEWAANRLLRRDWGATDGVDYHAKVRDLLPKFVARFDAAGVKADGVRRAATEQTQRDLTIELLWQGTADLDLSVTEPGGSVCNALAPRTVGGGVLTGDRIEQTDDGRAEVYAAASAFPGTYRVGVRTAFGRPVGNTATLKVTRFKGTPRESHDLLAVDLASGTPVEIRLDGGSRTDLAPVNPDVTTLRTAAAAAPASAGIGSRGLGGGFAPAGSATSSAVGGTGPDPRLPLVVQPWDQVLPGRGAAADVRATYRLNPDRQTFSVSARPVFDTAGGREVRLPRVPLLPGGGD